MYYSVRSSLRKTGKDLCIHLVIYDQGVSDSWRGLSIKREAVEHLTYMDEVTSKGKKGGDW
jgi:hypothetical protein